MIEKYERAGEVAVLVSRGFGAGWSTWNYGPKAEAMIFDPEIVHAILDDNLGKAEKIAEEKYPDTYKGGMKDLVVVWVLKGSRFEIREYDGSESLHIFGPADGYTA